jgi:DNA repair protein RadD
MIEDRYYQPEAVEKTIEYLFAHTGNPLIALPTGTGKSVVIVLLIMRLLGIYFPTRVLMLTHSLELVGQNAAKFTSMAPNIPLGINCDGIGRRDIMQQVIFGSIGSVIGMTDLFQPFDVIVIDEAHRVSEDEDSMYSKLIIWALAVNPKVRIVGLTATPYDNYGPIVRADEKTGLITSLFNSIVYNRIDPESFKEFVAKGWLASLIAIRTKTKYDLNNVGMSRGEFNQRQLQDATDIQVLTEAAVAEMIHVAHIDNRNCGLVFANGIRHSEHVCEEFQAQGATAVFVHSKMSKGKLLDAYDAFHTGAAQWMVNNGKLTTGYDHPPIDLLGVLRATNQLPLWAQILGRGTRPYDWMNPHHYKPGFEYRKLNTLVMDFADNTGRLGPIDAPYFKKRSKGDPGDAPVKICQKCDAYNYASARFCFACDNEFIFEVKFTAESSGAAPMSTADEQPTSVEYNVTFVNYEKIVSGGMAMLRVWYHCGMSKKFSEIVCLEHTSAAKQRAWGWWRSRTDLPVPGLVDAALKITSSLKRPIKITVEHNPATKYPKVLGHVFEQRATMVGNTDTQGNGGFGTPAYQ